METSRPAHFAPIVLVLGFFVGGSSSAQALRDIEIVTGSGAAVCPVGKKVVGGGAVAFTNDVLTATYPGSDTTWIARGTGGTSVETTYAICAKVDSSWQIVEGGCPAGKKVVGGGAIAIANDVLTATYPGSDTTWIGRGTGGTSVESAYAICANVDSSWQIVEGGCPAGKKVVGGGAVAITNDVLTATYPGSDTTWIGRGTGGTSVESAYAICILPPPPSDPDEPSKAHNMVVNHGAGTAVSVNYTPACGATDHVIYWGQSIGPITPGLSWSNSACGVGMSGSATFDPGDPPPSSFIYFVVVGQNATVEGSFGRDSSNSQRPEASGVGACDLPQSLNVTCQ